MSYSDDELLKMLETAEEAEGPVEYVDNVVPFLVRYDIKDGDERVSAKVMYKLYRAYTKEPVPYASFTKRISEILVPVKETHHLFYHVNMSAMKVSKEYYRLLSGEKKSGHANVREATHIQNFIEMYELENGTNWINSKEAYTLYRLKFIKYKQRPKMGFKRFVTVMKNYFNHKYKNNEGHWFGLNEKYKELVSPEDLEIVRKGGETKGRYTGRKRGTKKQEGSGEVSVSTSGTES